MSSVVLTALFYSGLFGEPGWSFFIEPGDQPPALSAAIAVIQIDLEYVPFCIFNHKIAPVSPSVPFTAAGWKAAISGINPFLQHFCHLMDFSVPREAQRLRRCFCLFHLDLLTEEFFHSGYKSLNYPASMQCYITENRMRIKDMRYKVTFN